MLETVFHLIIKKTKRADHKIQNMFGRYNCSTPIVNIVKDRSVYPSAAESTMLASLFRLLRFNLFKIKLPIEIQAQKLTAQRKNDFKCLIKAVNEGNNGSKCISFKGASEGKLASPYFMATKPIQAKASHGIRLVLSAMVWLVCFFEKDCLCILCFMFTELWFTLVFKVPLAGIVQS